MSKLRLQPWPTQEEIECPKTIKEIHDNILSPFKHYSLNVKTRLDGETPRMKGLHEMAKKYVLRPKDVGQFKVLHLT